MQDATKRRQMVQALARAASYRRTFAFHRHTPGGREWWKIMHRRTLDLSRQTRAAV